VCLRVACHTLQFVRVQKLADLAAMPLQTPAFMCSVVCWKNTQIAKNTHGKEKGEKRKSESSGPETQRLKRHREKVPVAEEGRTITAA
jgi:hypothetical protein